MHDPKIRSLQRQRQAGEELQHVTAGSPLYRGTVPKLAFGLLLRVRWVKEPAISGLLRSPKDVELVIAQDAGGVPAVYQVPNPINHGGAVGPAVAQVADEDQPAALWMIAVAVVPQPIQKRLQRVDLPVDIAHYINRPLRQLGNQRSSQGSTPAFIPPLGR